MSARLLSGTQVAGEIRAELKLEVNAMNSWYGVVPGLATILVGSDKASQSYVRGKQSTAHELGFYSIQRDLPADLKEEALIDLIASFNADPKVHGILVQLPLPRHINEEKVLLSIDPGKDVDAFHPVNVGKLMIGKPDYLPCTPAGIQELLLRSGVQISGAEVTVVGRSNIVGKPIAMMLMQKGPGGNATVTVCHTGTKDIAFHTRRADILIVAAGTPQYIKGNMIKPGAVVIDVGVNEVGRTADGKRILKGDVAFEEAVDVAGAITPVPGGVGPMTITMLMKNTVKACKLLNHINS